MYFKEQNTVTGVWYIADPEGTYICTVQSEDEANDLLSHLNRG